MEIFIGFIVHLLFELLRFCVVLIYLRNKMCFCANQVFINKIITKGQFKSLA